MSWRDDQRRNVGTRRAKTLIGQCRLKRDQHVIVACFVA
jgi:hypothetical protein